MNVVIIVTTPRIGSMYEEIAPTSWPPFPTISDISPRAEDKPSPVLTAVVLLYPALIKTGVTITILDAKDVMISIRAGIINMGIFDMSISAPTDTKNNAPNMSRRGTVITRAIAALFDSATSTPAKNAPMTGDSPS